MSYTTKDLQIATCIMSEGIKLLDWKKIDGRYLDFTFDSEDECKKIEREWFAGTLVVNARKYADSLSILKSLVFRPD